MKNRLFALAIASLAFLLFYSPEVIGRGGENIGNPAFHEVKGKKTSGGRVAVRGYTRKDGTYVRPHTRSAPKRK
jgi:hypothetical protein